MYSNIPSEMKSLPNWVCWQASPDPKGHSGIKKTPINPKTGGQAMSNNPDTWSDFDTAVTVSKQYSGIGFMFSNSPYFGVDIDDLPEDIKDFKTGKEDNIIGEFVNTLKSYAEYSQSCNGIHIICRGSLPTGKRRKKPVEMYENGRFFIMTGNRCSEYAGITDCTESIKPLHKKYLGEDKPRNKPQAVSLNTASDVIDKAINSKNGNLFNALLHGDTSAYTSQSEADLAFCNMLAFWTGCDTELMDDIFRQSGLMRDKWDRKQSGSTYGAITINKAVQGCETVYEPKQGDTYGFTIGKNTRKKKYYTMDDMGNAQRFFDLYGSVVRYCYPEKRWLYYDGKRWKTDNTGTLFRMADTVTDSMNEELKNYQQYDEQNGTDMEQAFEKHIKKSRSNRSKTSMVTELQHYVPILPSKLDKHDMKLNTPDHVLNLSTGEVIPHDKKLYLTKITSTGSADTADCPQWLKFLDDIFAGDKDLIRYVQKAVGYSLTGSTAEQCAFFLFGTGRNGKSTFIDIIAEIFGDYAANIQPETIMVKSTQSNGASGDIARLSGARLVTSVEPNEGVRLNEGLLKQLTGGDTVTARKLYSEEFEFKPEFKLWLSTNHKPIIRGTDTGIWRRIKIIPFNVQIPESKVDKELKQKLRGELPQILCWCIDGCTLYQREGLHPVKAIADSVKEYKREMDVISVFIDDMCIEEGNVQSSLLFAAYSDWARRNNEYEMSATKFGIEIAKRYKRIKGKSNYIYQGISLS